MKAVTAYPTLVGRLWPNQGSTLTRTVLLAMFGSLLLWASAKVQVPMWPVPMTMQSFVVLVIGMAYGARLATATVGLYLLEGALGLPVFAGTPEKGIGFLYMMGPTGGFLLGFLIAAAAMGWLAERGWDRTLPKAIAAMTLGTILLFTPGILWLTALFGGTKAIAVGLTPFILGSVLKLALAAALIPLAWKAVDRRRGQ